MSGNKTFARGMAIFVAWTVAAIAHAQTPDLGTPGHLRLVAPLDRPQDGYCLDILGVGDTLRLELPIFAHNCKPGLTTDSAVAFTPEGRVRFVAVDLCITAMGVNGRALPGSAILLRPCGHATAFFASGPLQGFSFEDDGRMRLQGSDLCLAAGPVSATTYSPADAWRVLSVESCDTHPTDLTRWEFTDGNTPMR